jgi:hypothetical protein
MESKRFPSVNEQLVRLLAETSSNFDIAGHYAKHRKQHYLRYGEQGYQPAITNYIGIITHYTPALANYTGIITHYTPDSINYIGIITHYTPAIANYLSVITYYMLAIAIFTILSSRFCASLSAFLQINVPQIKQNSFLRC